MIENTELASAMETRGKGKAIDDYCKRVLSNKDVVSFILEKLVLDNKGYCGIKESNIVDESIPGARIEYDKLYEVKLPKTKIFVNIEAQSKENPGYPLMNRAVYYVSRLIAKQKNKSEGFMKSRYGEMKEVYSIWIVMDMDVKKEKMIEVHTFPEKEDKTLMNIIMVYPLKEDSENEVIRFLHILFVSDMEAAKKKQILEEKYKIKMTRELEEAMDDMCNVIEYYERKSRVEALAEGKEVGIVEGEINTTLKAIEKIEKNMNLSREEAMEILEQTRKQYWDARHHCWAYIIGRNPAAERMSDDGEPAGTAGKPILEVIRGRELTNVLVIVTRYFGGTLLGTGGLVRAYTAATLEGLKNSESIARIHGVKLGIETNYTDLGKIQYLIANRNLDQLEPVYTDKVEMTVFVPTDEMGSLRAELMEGTNGQVVLDEETTCWFARTEDGIKIFDEE